MVELVVFILVSLGISAAWNLADIFEYPRLLAGFIPYLNKPLLCPECNSFWIGIFVSLFLNPINSLTYIGLSNFFCGIISHLIAVVFYRKIVTIKL